MNSDNPNISLVNALWHFIENSGSAEEFFELRQRVREHGDLHDASVLLCALEVRNPLGRP